MLLTGEGCDQCIQQACCNRQNDLAPQVGSLPTDIHTAGHCRTYHAKHSQPGQHFFGADIKMRFSFHYKIIIHDFAITCKKIHRRILNGQLPTEFAGATIGRPLRQKNTAAADERCSPLQYYKLHFNALIYSGAVPPQPPRMEAPISWHCFTIPANSSGIIG